MKDEIFNIVTDLINNKITKDNAIDNLLNIYNLKLSTFQKNRLDILNWAKSELKQETNTKLDKKITPYRDDKVRFLRKIIYWIKN